MTRVVMIRLPRPVPLGLQLSPPSVLLTTRPALSAYRVVGFCGSTRMEDSSRLGRPVAGSRDQVPAALVLRYSPLPFRKACSGLAIGKLSEELYPVTRASPLAGSTAIPRPLSELLPPR